MLALVFELYVSQTHLCRRHGVVAGDMRTIAKRSAANIPKQAMRSTMKATRTVGGAGVYKVLFAHLRERKFVRYASARYV